jgi:hypothetical protein
MVQFSKINIDPLLINLNFSIKCQFWDIVHPSPIFGIDDFYLLQKF